ncbi:MAG: phosphotyrosine protein phosphatase [Marinosulfonomonas sp.]|nr:MAG: phosphotyrosine protein phosphatase [Marinosulfonomonas sp.]
MTNVLFICGKARKRSPTAADVLARWQGFSTDFAGLSRDADEVVSPEHIDWADIIFVMERKHKARLRTKFGSLAAGLKLISLDIPDKFDTHEPALVDILIQKLTAHFGPIT